MKEVASKTPKTPKKKQKCKWIRYKFPSRPEVFESFAEWMCFPKSLRKPKTQGEFAILHECSPDTLSSYKQKPAFWEKVSENKEKLRSQISDAELLKDFIEELK